MKTAKRLRESGFYDIADIAEKHAIDRKTHRLLIMWIIIDMIGAAGLFIGAFTSLWPLFILGLIIFLIGQIVLWTSSRLN